MSGDTSIAELPRSVLNESSNQDQTTRDHRWSSSGRLSDARSSYTPPGKVAAATSLPGTLKTQSASLATAEEAVDVHVASPRGINYSIGRVSTLNGDDSFLMESFRAPTRQESYRQDQQESAKAAASTMRSANLPSSLINSAALNDIGVNAGDLLRSLVERSVAEAMSEIRNDVQNLHVEFIKHSLAQQNTLQQILMALPTSYQKISEELKRVNDENERLKLRLNIQ
jgi:hypothetical protein